MMKDRIFYHIYPLGFCGAPRENDFSCPPGQGLRDLEDRLPYLKELGVNALYLGPLFESGTHGYDTLDYYHVDRRLGNNEALRALVAACHREDILVVLDAVFNHTGRHFFAFRDLQEKGAASAYRDWYAQLDFSGQSPRGDPFRYEGWNGSYDLVKLNGHSREVRDHLFGAVQYWIEEFDIDGLRLDAADLLLPDFMDELSRQGKSLKPDFWLMGEVIHGDYRQWAREGRLDSVTNYELYKGLWSSFNDRNFFELAWTLNRQSGPEGMYRDLRLYNFADNHDVNRAASILKNPAHLFPLYGLLFTLPGIPSIYYGSELALRGERGKHSDDALRPAWTFSPAHPPAPEGEALLRAVKEFTGIRKQKAALREGSYRELLKSPEQFAFLREAPRTQAPGPQVPADGGDILVAVNSAESGRSVHIPAEALGKGGVWRDLLSGKEFPSGPGGLDLPLDPSWMRILERGEAWGA